MMQAIDYRHPGLDSQALSAAKLSQIARDLYATTQGKWQLLQRLRPYICPFDELIALVPPKSRVLDVGCGAGLFLLLLGKLNWLERGEGFDVSAPAVAAAQRAAASARLAVTPHFHVRSIEDGVPGGDWSLITVIDVLHHVPPQFQQDFLSQVARMLPPGGRLLIKDMVQGPTWRAAANQLHDLVMARQWVHHANPSAVEQCLAPSRLRCIHRSRANRLWYGHWTLMFERPAKR